MKIVGALDADTLRILRSLPGVAAVEDPIPAGERGIAVITAAGRDHRVAVETRSRVNAGTARELIGLAQQRETPLLLVVAGQTTEDARRLLREHGVGMVDACGNSHLEFPGVVIHVEGGQRSQGAPASAPPTRLAGKAGLVAQALLCQPHQAWKVTGLAETAGVSTGLTHRVLARLEGEGIVRSEGAGPGRVRHVANPAALLDLWAEEQRGQPIRTLAYLLAQTSAKVIEHLTDRLEAAGIEHGLTGVAGASLAAPYVTAVLVAEVWVAATAASEYLCQATGAEHVTTGHNVVFLQAKDDAPLVFRRRIAQRWVVNPFRLYVDLRHHPQRGREQAEHLRRELIGF